MIASSEDMSYCLPVTGYNIGARLFQGVSEKITQLIFFELVGADHRLVISDVAVPVLLEVFLELT